jgi:hypothetical protein
LAAPPAARHVSHRLGKHNMIGLQPPGNGFGLRKSTRFRVERRNSRSTAPLNKAQIKSPSDARSRPRPARTATGHAPLHWNGPLGMSALLHHLIRREAERPNSHGNYGGLPQPHGMLLINCGILFLDNKNPGGSFLRSPGRSGFYRWHLACIFPADAEFFCRSSRAGVARPLPQPRTQRNR